MAASVAVHVVLLALVAVQSPRLAVPVSEGGPPQAVIPILLMPRAPQSAAKPGAKPTEIRLHRRAQRFADDFPPIPPLIIPTPDAPREAPVQDTKPTAPARPPDPIGPGARAALRGKLGCANASLLGLSRAEREACEDRFAAGARQAPFTGLGIERNKANGLAAAAARRTQDFNYKRGVYAPSPPQEGAAWDKGRGPEGQAAAIGSDLKNDRPAATVPF